tara:strand:- start:1026 stop:1277 length:252 start_codon:yes stop_codon:yes gene_type:complete
MNKLILNNKPINTTNEEFTKAWNNSSFVFEALYKTMLQIKKDIDNIKREDFDCPNHYAKLAYNAGQSKIIDTIVSMLPETAKM